MLNNEQDERELSDVTRQLEDKRLTIISLEADLARLREYSRTEQQNIIALSKNKETLEESVEGLTNKVTFLLSQEIDINERIEVQRNELSKLTDYIKSQVESQSRLEEDYRTKTAILEKSLNEYEQKVKVLSEKEKEYAENHKVIEAKVMKLKAIMEAIS